MRTHKLKREEVEVVTDPLVELRGRWTTDLAERYLPIEGLPPTKYECLDGNLIMSPRENTGNSFATIELGALLRGPARKAGCFAYSSVNMRFTDKRWIEPDMTVLRQPMKRAVWVQAEVVLMPIEFVSPSSVRSDRIDKPALCAAVGVPYFMTVEIGDSAAEVELLRLNDAGEYVVQARAMSGQEFRTDLPFPLSFDPFELMEP